MCKIPTFKDLLLYVSKSVLALHFERMEHFFVIMEEIWKDVVGYEGLYQVSNLGNVRSTDKYVNGKNDTKRFVKGKILKKHKNRFGYLYVHLSLGKRNHHKFSSIHRLVATAFIPKVDGKHNIDHINGKRDDNRVCNLRWCTTKENNSFPIYIQNKTLSSIKYHVLQIDKIDGKIIKEWDSCHEIARVLGFNQGHICDCCNGKRKSSNGYFWKYKTS